MLQEIEEYVRSLRLDAYLVGGAVRDELLGLESKDADFLVPGLDTDGLRAALSPHGRVEDLVVADRLVGIRLHPSNRKIRNLTRARVATTSRSSPTPRCRSMRTCADATSRSTRWPDG